MTHALLAALLAALPPCTLANIGQCVPAYGGSEACGSTATGLGWFWVAGCSEPKTVAAFERRETLLQPDAGVVLFVAGDVDAGSSDAPLRPPELVDDLGNVGPMGAADLEPGVVCATHVQAVKQRDDKVACHAALQTMQAGSGVDWPLLLGATGIAALLGAAVGAGVVAATHHSP